MKKPGRLVDANFVPLSGKTVQIQFGGKTVTRKTNAAGYFDLGPHEKVLNYGLADVWTSTGSSVWRTSVYSETKPLLIRCVDAHGKPIDGIAIAIGSERTESRHGEVLFKDVAVALRLRHVFFYGPSGKWRLVGVSRSITSNQVELQARFKPQSPPFQKPVPMTYHGGKVRFHGAG